MTSFGGNPPLPADALMAAESIGGPHLRWFAAGRDAYLAVANALAVSTWILPAFLCPVVPAVLQRAGRTCIAYRPGHLADVPIEVRRQAACVVMWDVDCAPPAADREAAAESAAMVEDRCLWAGLPSDLANVRTWRIGSPRKWLGIAGGWVSGPGALPPTTVPPATDHVLAMASGGLLRALRQHHEHPTLESATVVAVQHAEQALGIPDQPRPRSRLCAALMDAVANHHAVIDARWQCGLAVAAALQLPPPTIGGIGLRMLVPQRDELIARLANVGIFAPVHWRDGDWSGDREAAILAATSLTIPTPALNEADRAEYVRRLREVVPAALNRANGGL